MISIRQGTFETNSSSTHCICFDSEKGTKYSEDDLLKVKGVLTPFQDDETDEFNIYTSIKDKVRWLLSSVAQHGYDPMFPHPIIKMLEQLLPNAKFEMPTEHYYELEDIECVWDKYWDQVVADGDILLKGDMLKKVLLEGVIIWGNRDRCYLDPTGWYSDIDYTVEDYSSCILRVSG